MPGRVTFEPLAAVCMSYILFLMFMPGTVVHDAHAGMQSTGRQITISTHAHTHTKQSETKQNETK